MNFPAKWDAIIDKAITQEAITQGESRIRLQALLSAVAVAVCAVQVRAAPLTDAWNGPRKPSSFKTVIAERTSLSTDERLPAPRWMFRDGQAPRGESTEALMAAMRAAQSGKKAEACLDFAEKALKQAHKDKKDLRAWILLGELRCAVDLPFSTKSANRLARLLDVLEKNAGWMIVGPQAPALRQAVIAASLSLLERDTKTNRARAWRSVDRTQDILTYANEETRARYWRLTAELAFSDRNLEASREYFQRSLLELENEQVRARLRAIESMLETGAKGLDKRLSPLSQEQVPVATDASAGPGPEAGTDDANAQGAITGSSRLEASKEELDLVERISAAMKSGDLLPAVDDAVKLIRKFPGGTRAKWASDRALDAYLSMSDRTDEKYALLREQMLKRMEKADEDRLGEWARVLFNRGQYEASYVLARRSLETMSGARATRVLMIAAEAAIACEKYQDAQNDLETLIEKHAGTATAREALMRSGLISYRLGDYSKAVASFERLLVLPQIEKFELIAMHWLWRALQKQKAERATQVADELIRRFPFSYYGLRAYLERNGNVLEWKASSEKIQSKIWLTGDERRAVDRMRSLLEAGWLDEAQAEIATLPEPRKPEDKAIRAMMWAAAAHYVKATRLANQAWDERSEFRTTPLVFTSFPSDFSSMIAAQAEARKLDRYLVRGLIKQESGYSVKAVSSSNALGLMQIIPPTALEIATDLNLGGLRLPDDMFDPSRNIQMGTYYLSKMLRKYDGHVPLALAAYNAGPGRIDRWLRARPSMNGVAALRSSAPDDEIWFDEIPYWETGLYVKAILRNVLLYRVLDEGRVEVPNPVWSTW